VTSDLAGDLLAVKGSPAQLLRVVTNLLTNAREAMQDAGELLVRTENVYIDQPRNGFSHTIEVGEYVRLEVADSGGGISPEVRDRIFDAFFTTKTTGKRRGSGLGLSVVQTIVEDHGGHLDLDTEVGRGSTFTIYLPVVRQPMADAPVPQELRGGTESILVVDDDHLQREVATELLQSLGYHAEAVASGDEALAHLASNSPDLLILDMIMPGMDGAETFRRVHEIRPCQRAIIVSGYSESDRVTEAMRLGAGAYLRKPMTLEKLGFAVRAELDRQTTG
jgi:CheY-like chemotaxis protein